MDIKEAINQEFDKFVTDNFKKEGIRNFLLKHERRNILADNLKREIDGSSHILLPLDKTLEEKRKIIRGLCQDFSRMFCKTALEVKEAEYMSNIKTIGDTLNQDDVLENLDELDL